MTEAIKSAVVMPAPEDGARDPVDGRAVADPTATAAVPVSRADGAGEPEVPAAAGTEAPDAAWDLFGDVFADHVSGLVRDADSAERSAREHLSQGHGVDMAVALRAIAAEARHRARDDEAIGSALRGLGVEVTAAHLDTVADQMAAIGGFDLVEVIGPGPETADADTAGDDDLVVSARADAVGQFDLLVTNHLMPALSQAPPLPADELEDERFPLDLQERDLRTRGLLAITWRRQLDELRQTDPGNVLLRRVLSLAILLVEDRSARGAFPMTQLARAIVGTDPTPLHTAERLRQLSVLLDERLLAPGVQSQVINAADGLSPAGKLSMVASEIDRIASTPAELAKARITGVFVTAKQWAVRDRDRGVAASASAAASEEAAEAAAGAGSSAAASDSPPEAVKASGINSPTETSTQFDPDLPVEQALLGSLLYAPAAIGKIEKILGARDFSNPEMRVVYETLRVLHRSGGLYDVASMPTEGKRLSRAQENHLKLFDALKSSVVPHSLSKRDIQRVVAEINAAAPAASVPFRGVFDPAAQSRLVRMVWETGFSRRLASMAVQMNRRTPLISPDRLIPDRSARSARNLAATLTTIDGQLDAMAAQLASAVRRTGVDPDGERAASTVVDASRSWRMPDPLRPALAPLRHRAERHVLHLALHAGHMESIPQAILDLQPEHFSSERHANLWRTIKDVQSRGEPVNWVAVHWETRNPDFAHQPMPSVKELAKLGAPPEVDHGKVRRSLGLLVSSALARAKADVQSALVALADTSKVPSEAGIAEAKAQVRNLRAHASTAAEQLEQISAVRASARPNPPRLHPVEPPTRAGGPRA